MTKLSNQFALVNGQIAPPTVMIDGKSLLIEDGQIVSIVNKDELASDIQLIDVDRRFIALGLIDIHIHGGNGHTFNEPTAEAFTHSRSVITRETARNGVTSLLATTATDSIDNMVAVLEFTWGWLTSEQIQADPSGTQVLGVHVEGPYFAMGKRGAQDPAHIRNPDDGTPERLLAHHELIRIMSYAPELPGALELTKRLVELGIIAAAGHSSAREEDVAPSIEAGLRHMIHIWREHPVHNDQRRTMAQAWAAGSSFDQRAPDRRNDSRWKASAPPL